HRFLSPLPRLARPRGRPGPSHHRPRAAGTGGDLGAVWGAERALSPGGPPDVVGLCLLCDGLAPWVFGAWPARRGRAAARDSSGAAGRDLAPDSPRGAHRAVRGPRITFLIS